MQHNPRTRFTRVAVFALSLLFSVSALAQFAFVRPSGPTTRTPVTLVVFATCFYGKTPLTEVSGYRIRYYVPPGMCDPPWPPERFEIPLGLLPAGEYRVEEAGRNEPAMTFVVRDAEPRPLTVTPFAVPITQLAPIQARITGGNSQLEPLCLQGGVCRVWVDGVESANVRVDAEGHVWFVPPPGPRGLHSVAVENASLRREADNAIYYFDRNAPPDRSIFERVLFPLLTEVPGLNNSLWRTEATISNPLPAYVENYNEILPFLCIDYPCGERLAPGELVKFEGGDYPAGVALLAPWAESAKLSFGLRGRDVSRAAAGYGTEIPVVRESEMFHEAMTMLEVPLQAGYRSKLRIYAFDSHYQGGSGAVVRIFRADGTFMTRSVEMDRDCTGRECHATPWYGELDLPSDLGRADVYVKVDAELAWSFISVTNNATQQVTLVTPDGRGGAPCDLLPCGGSL